MAKPTLLEIVQDILAAIDGDEVSSIGDTWESEQIAKLVRSAYRGIAEELDLQYTEGLWQLDSDGDTSIPTHMNMPANAYDLHVLSYNNKLVTDSAAAFVELTYVSPTEFLRRTSNLNPTDSNVQSVTDPGSSVVFNIHNDRGPSIWTSFDGGETIVMDAFDSAKESTLTAASTQCVGRLRQDLTIADTSTIPLPETQQQYVINEARELAFSIYKDGVPSKVNELTRRSKMKAKERKNKVAAPHPIERLPNYGRK